MRTEAECLKLLRRASLSSETLEEILGDRAARKYHAVRRALAAHPKTPRTDALALVATLFWRDLAHLSADSRVHPAIRRAADQDLLRRLSEMAISEKVDLARNVGRGTLLVLRLDPDPRVLASVLENRFTIEADVIQAASSRSAAPESLALVAEHPRWGARSGVRSAILRNPESARVPRTGAPDPGQSRGPSGCSGVPALTGAAQGLRGESSCGEVTRGLA